MPIRHVSVTDHFDTFIESGIESGRFRDVSEVVGEGLQLLEQRDRVYEAKVVWLRAATKEAFDAFDRGEGIPLDSVAAIDDFVKEAVAEIRTARDVTNG